MRTVHCSGHCGGVVFTQCMLGYMGVSAPMHAGIHSLPRGVSAPMHAGIHRGCLPQWMLGYTVSAQGVSTPMHARIHTPPVNRMTDRTQQAQGPKTPRPIRIKQCFPTGVVRTWYGVCMECRYRVGTEWVRSRYRARGFSRGRGVKIALKGPRNVFRGVISLRKNFDFFLPPSSVPALYFYPVTWL